MWADYVLLNQIIRKASVLWTGKATGRTRTVTTESGVLQNVDVASGGSLKNTFEADPPELIAAAYASSFSLALSEELAQIGFTEGEITTTAMLKLEELPAGWTIAKVNLNVVARLPRMTQGEFIDATIRAKTTCLISRSLRANVSMNAKLEP